MIRETAAAVAIDGGELPLGGGLLALVRPSLDLLEPGGVLAVLSREKSVGEDFPAWCRSERHQYLGSEPVADGVQRHLIARGRYSVPRKPAAPEAPVEPRDGRLTVADVLEAAPMPERADPSSGFAPRGASVEPGGPSYPFVLNERDQVAPPEIGRLYDQAVSAQWDANRDIPWSKAARLDAPVAHALAQIMTFLAENELSALYLPSRFISQIHPAFAEVAMFLASQLADEARHIDVFTKRARLCNTGLGVSSVATSQSLLSLIRTNDFTEAAFLLSVLGEGTFLDLLSFIERHAPDEPTAELTRRARTDESRHVHFGLAHVRWAMSHDSKLYKRLEAAVRRRASQLHSVSGVPARVQDALTILAAGGAEPRAVARGHEAFRQLLDEMHQNRMKRLEHAGFTADQAERISQLHTPNFM